LVHVKNTLKDVRFFFVLTCFLFDFSAQSQLKKNEGEEFGEHQIEIDSDGIQNISRLLSSGKEHIVRGNRILADQYNRVKGLDDVYVIGDVASIQSSLYPNGNAMLASVAEQQGFQLAKNLNRVARNKTMKHFKYNDKGTMATIGRNHAVVDLPFMKISGILGWFIWMLVHLMLLVDFRNRLIVFFNWAWSYINYDKGTRVIIRKFKNSNI
jgi:NADH dehydrogenase